jgi:hypothetical protein
MFLCAYDGKLYDNTEIQKETIFILGCDYGNSSTKDYKCGTCTQCWGLINIKYKLNKDGKFIIPIDDKIKLYRISSYNVDNTVDIEKPVDSNKKLVTDILKVMKSNEKKVCKKSKKCI